jgi:hypothetical protein
MAKGFNSLPEVIALIQKAAEDMVVQSAKNIAKTAVDNAPEQTGFMASTVYTSTKEGSTYGQGAGSPPKDSTMMPEVPKPANAQSAWVAVAADYAIDVEMGTIHMAPEPYLIPALESERPNFESGKYLKDAIDAMRLPS